MLHYSTFIKSDKCFCFEQLNRSPQGSIVANSFVNADTPTVQVIAIMQLHISFAYK